MSVFYRKKYVSRNTVRSHVSSRRDTPSPTELNDSQNLGRLRGLGPGTRRGFRVRFTVSSYSKIKLFRYVLNQATGTPSQKSLLVRTLPPRPRPLPFSESSRRRRASSCTFARSPYLHSKNVMNRGWEAGHPRRQRSQVRVCHALHTRAMARSQCMLT
jgi:hypothetical protein